MGRSITGPGSGSTAGGGGLTDRITPPGWMGSITVPNYATACYVTGVAAGGCSMSEVTQTPGSAQSGIVYMSCGPKGRFPMGHCEGISGTTSPVVFDGLGRKLPFSGSTQLSSGNIYFLGSNDAGWGAIVGSVGGGHYTVDAGVTWNTFNPPTLPPGASNDVYCGTYTSAEDILSTRAAMILSGQTQFSLWSPYRNNFVNSQTTYSGKQFYFASYVNDYLVIGESNSTTKTSIYYMDAANLDDRDIVAVVVDGTNQRTPRSIAYGNGIYVLFCTDGTAYSATSLAGPWTQRTSGVSGSGFVKFGGGRFLYVCFNNVTTSTDGINWTATTLSGAQATYKGHFEYMSRLGLWVVSKNGAAQWASYSSNGTTWTGCVQSGISSTSMTYMLDTPGGLIVTQGAITSSWFLGDPRASSGHQSFSTSKDGGPLKVIRISNNEELLSLCGGYSNGKGGSSFASIGQGASAVGLGIGGHGSIPNTAPGVGTGATVWSTATSYAGSGGAPMLWEIPETAYGVKIPGGHGGNTASFGGGGSILARASQGAPAVGYGGGGMGTTACGGGGEGVVRFKISVVPGETLAYTAGSPYMHYYMQATGSPYGAGIGFISFEFAQG